MLLRIALPLILLLAWTASGAQDKAAANDGPKGPPSKEKRITGKDGKVYIERKTPFGTAKVEEKPEDTKPEEPPANMRAFDDGDTVRFERPTPFGVARWTRKKSELTESERAALERERTRKSQKQAPKQ